MSGRSAWLTQLLANLARSGALGESSARYLAERAIRVGIHDQPTGARWTLTRGIQLNPRCANDPPDDPYTLSLLVHEVQHLRQGPWTALSVYGELEAWQAQFSFLKSAVGHFNDEERKDRIIAQLMALPHAWDRSGLDRARRLMRDYAGSRYRIDLLPLFPIQKELALRLLRRRPSG